MNRPDMHQIHDDDAPSQRKDRPMKTLKQRYAEHREKCENLVKEIERHDPKMAESARKVLSVPKEKGPDHD